MKKLLIILIATSFLASCGAGGVSSSGTQETNKFNPSVGIYKDKSGTDTEMYLTVGSSNNVKNLDGKFKSVIFGINGLQQFNNKDTCLIFKIKNVSYQATNCSVAYDEIILTIDGYEAHFKKIYDPTKRKVKIQNESSEVYII